MEAQVQMLKQTVEEFKESSSQVERELESQLQEALSRLAQTEQENVKLTRELEHFRKRQAQIAAERVSSEEQLRQSRTSLTITEQEKRNLELLNDMLEKRERELSCKSSELESQLEAALETYAMLRCEHDEQQQKSLEQIQRLKDQLSEIALDNQLQNGKPNNININIAPSLCLEKAHHSSRSSHSYRSLLQAAASSPRNAQKTYKSHLPSSPRRSELDNLISRTSLSRFKSDEALHLIGSLLSDVRKMTAKLSDTAIGTN
eukprot:GILK01007051.1.p1 GENE.GILK01007051.1~~GILK01007051.1.p1  ORF type:complete len:297 (-),score=60.98 GILK01007051.1:94-876(-)